MELTELARNLTPPGDTATLVRRETELAERRYFAGDPTGARHELERSLASLPAGEDRARVLLELGSLLWVQGESEQGLALHVPGARRGADPGAARQDPFPDLGAGRRRRHLRGARRGGAWRCWTSTRTRILYCFALHNLALFKLYAGHGADHAAIEKGMALQRDVAAWEMSTVPAFWARNFDDFDTARKRFEDILRAFREQGDEATVSGVLTHLARLEVMTGRMDRARAAGGRGAGPRRADRAGDLPAHGAVREGPRVRPGG